MASSEQSRVPLLSRRGEAAAGPVSGRDESAPPTDDGEGPSLGLFMRQLAEIVPDRPISPESDLIDDLGFDALAFSQLAVTIYEHYGIEGLAAASLRSHESLTVEGFFRRCVLGALYCATGEG